MFRSDWKWAIIMAVAGMVTAGLSCLVFPFIYNKLYLDDLLNSGWAFANAPVAAAPVAAVANASATQAINVVIHNAPPAADKE